jgi:hypothetical protein
MKTNDEIGTDRKGQSICSRKAAQHGIQPTRSASLRARLMLTLGRIISILCCQEPNKVTYEAYRYAHDPL